MSSELRWQMCCPCAPTFFCHVDEDNDDDIILSLRNLPLVEGRQTIFMIFDSVAQKWVAMREMVLDAKGRAFMTFALSNARLLLPGLWNSSVDKENQENNMFGMFGPKLLP